MSSVRFCPRPSWRRSLVLYGSFLAALPGLPVFVRVLYMLDICSSIDDRAAAIMTPVSIVVGMAASVLVIVVGHRLFGPDDNFLLLDQDGLSYMRRGKSRNWPWSVLPGFKTVFRYRQIRFVLPEGEIESKRRDPWIHEMTPDGPVVAIQDIYDAPFDEIAAKLNEYRDRASGRQTDV